MEAPAPGRQACRSAGRLTITQRHHRARRARAHAAIRRSSSYANLSLLPLSTALAQNDKPVPVNVFNPPAWPTLSLNSNQQPSCAFWTPAGKAPEYFCAAGIANIGYDADTSLCTPLGCAGFALRAIHVDPQTGNVSAGPPTIKAQSVALPVNPDVLECTPLQDQFGTSKIGCLLRNDPGPTQTSFVHSVTWDGTSWGNPTVILNGFSFNFVSNFSCAPWVGSTAHPKNITCFALAKFENDGPADSVRILHWTWDGVTWNPPATATGTHFEVSPIAGISASRLICNSPAPDRFACFLHSPAGGAFVNELTADGSNWTQSNGLAWSSTPHQFGQLIAGLSTPPTCLAAQSASNAPARNDCFIGDNGVPVDPPINWGWLYWVPDDNSRNFAVAMTERFQISDPPSCVQWAVGQIECNRYELPRLQRSACASVAVRHPVLTQGLDDVWNVGMGVAQEFLGLAALPWWSK